MKTALAGGGQRGGELLTPAHHARRRARRPSALALRIRRLGGVDVKSDPQRPELFSQFVYPQFRGLGLGGLLEHFWWTYLDSQRCSTGFMRMELDSNQALFEKRLASGYCRQVSAQELAPRFVRACGNCELFGSDCRRQVFLAVDVRKALASSIRSRGKLQIGSLPIRITLARKHRASIYATREARAVPIS
jgi:hypothetical protein